MNAYQTVCGVVMADGVEIGSVECDEDKEKIYKTDLNKAKVFFLANPEVDRVSHTNEKGIELDYGWLLFKDNVLVNMYLHPARIADMKRAGVPVVVVEDKPFLPSGDLVSVC